MSDARKIKATEDEIRSLDRKMTLLQRNKAELVSVLRRLRSDAALAAAAQKAPVAICF